MRLMRIKTRNNCIMYVNTNHIKQIYKSSKEKCWVFVLTEDTEIHCNELPKELQEVINLNEIQS